VRRLRPDGPSRRGSAEQGEGQLHSLCRRGGSSHRGQVGWVGVRRLDPPRVEHDQWTTEAARQADLAERAPGAAERDDRITAGDDTEVACVTDGAADRVREVRGRTATVVLGEDPDGDAACTSHSSGDRLHDSLAAAADHDDAALGEELTQLLGLRRQLG